MLDEVMADTAALGSSWFSEYKAGLPRRWNMDPLCVGRTCARGMRGMRALGVLVMVGALALGGCGEKDEVGYRVTVEVDDNGTSHTGTGVWNVSMREGGFPDKYTSRFRGEAIPVDIGAKGTLFVLIVERSADGRPTSSELGIYGRHLFGDVARRKRGEPEKHLDPLQETRELSTMVGETAMLDCANPPTKFTPCPFMVKFRNINDPKSVEAVDPNNLTATFGSEVRLKPIKVTITDEPVTTGIENRFSWWRDYFNRHFDGTSTGYQDLTTSDIKAALSSGYFSTEAEQELKSPSSSPRP